VARLFILMAVPAHSRAHIMATASAAVPSLLTNTSGQSLVSSLDQSLRNLGSEPNLWQSFVGINRPERTTHAEQERPPAAAADDQQHHEDPAAPSLEALTRRFAPKHMEQPFQQLYRILQPALSPTTTSGSNATSRKNASAILQGGRGSGKSLLVQQVLRAFVDDNDDDVRCPFRLVYIHGVVVPGHNVVMVVREMLRQLSQQASTNNNKKKNNKEAYLRLKTTSFTNQLQLLSEMIQLASVDGVPIVFVLDELDQFVMAQGSHHTNGGSNSNDPQQQQQHRQLLLYHLLDRVASSHSLCSLIGMTTDCSFLSRLEKRIKSRAEGTTQFLYLPSSPSSYNKVIDILMDSLVDNNMAPYASTVQRLLKESEPLERCHRLGYDIRWFRRLLYQALALYRHDVAAAAAASGGGTTLPPGMSAEHLQDACDAVAVRRPNHDLLSDLRGAQVALVLAARRVLFRESVVNNNNNGSSGQAAVTAAATVPRLTYDRMVTELGSFRGAAAFSNKDLWNAFLDLLETGVLRPASDHCGTAPLSYGWEDDDPMDQDEAVLQDTTLHLTLDIHREVKPAIDDNVFQCSTALKEWGRKTI
jgi:Cdc6-like AAA superfamily ATPase